jgi:hypothetical protein
MGEWTSKLDGGQCQLHDPALYPRGYRSRYPLDRRLGGPQSRSGLYGVKKNLLLLGELRPSPRHYISWYSAIK